MDYTIYADRVLGDLGGGVLFTQCAMTILPMCSLAVGMDGWLLDLYVRGCPWMEIRWIALLLQSSVTNASCRGFIAGL